MDYNEMKIRPEKFPDMFISNEPSMAKMETAKDIISNMASILAELKNTVDAVESALYAPVNSDRGMDKDPTSLCLLSDLRYQRDLAEEILKKAIHIREGLW